MSLPSAQQLISQLRFRQLQMLCVLAEKGSMRAAAEEMHLTAPALSKSLRELEALLGRTLFTRTSQGIVPTPQGEAFVRTARAMVGEMRTLLALEDGGRATSALPLRVGAISYAIWALMPQV